MGILLIVIVALAHFALINPLEKIVVQTITNESWTKRPSAVCQKSITFGCYGMPSGHAETIMIIVILLSKMNILPLVVLVIVAVGVCAERVINKKHTIMQVLVGASIGTLYGLLYASLSNVMILLICFMYVTFFYFLKIIINKLT